MFIPLNIMTIISKKNFVAPKQVEPLLVVFASWERLFQESYLLKSVKGTNTTLQTQDKTGFYTEVVEYRTDWSAHKKKQMLLLPTTAWAVIAVVNGSASLHLFDQTSSHFMC